ncbi:hypothetical protein GCM10010387_65700 [Streptomyces inusitatus]|uniref:Uncharacterized protein n=1 Tax=Streptomyces inusitatus TaxID=68221 RepID=A0A918V329_9ACTN|nr:hypothetical protein GCM10010387_65700 [Streptomyces inusitatus]
MRFEIFRGTTCGECSGLGEASRLGWDIEEFHTVVRRHRLVRGWETAVHWLRSANSARFFRRRTTRNP